MFLLKKLVKVFIFFSSFTLCIPFAKEIQLASKIDNVITGKKEKSIYEGYIYIPKFGYKNLIKKNESALDENLVEMPEYSDEIGGNNIILAGHNNKYVFHKIYYLEKGDEIILSDFLSDYKYTVDKIKYIYVNDYDSLYNDDSITLMTCTDNNQERYIVVAKRD